MVRLNRFSAGASVAGRAARGRERAGCSGELRLAAGRARDVALRDQGRRADERRPVAEADRPREAAARVRAAEGHAACPACRPAGEDVDADAANGLASLGEASGDPGVRALALADLLRIHGQLDRQPCVGRALCCVRGIQRRRPRCVRDEQRIPRVCRARVRVAEHSGHRECGHDQGSAGSRTLRRRDVGRGEADLDLGRRELRLGADGPVDEHGDFEPGVVERGLDEPHGFVADTFAARKLQLVRVRARIACGDRSLDLDRGGSDPEDGVEVADLRARRLGERHPIPARCVERDHARGVVGLALADADDHRATAPETVAGPGREQRRVVGGKCVAPESERKSAHRREQDEANRFRQVRDPFRWDETP